MANKTLTVNGQPFTINRDRKAEVSQLSVNGQAFHIDRTAPVIESDPVGNSRPLLDKLVGGAAAAYSLRDLNSKQGDTNVVNVRRATDNEEKIFQAKDVDKIEDWVNGKQETTLPADSSQGLTVVVQHSSINSGNSTTINFYAEGSNTEGATRFFSNDKTYKFYQGTSDNRYILQLTNSTNLIKASASDADKAPQDVVLYEALTGTLTSITVTSASPAAAAYSLRKVNSSYGIPTTLVNGFDNFPSPVPSSSSPADVGNGLEFFAISGGVHNSNSRTITDGVLRISASKHGSAGTFSAGARVQGLQAGKQYTVSGEFRVTSSGADGDAMARVDISDNTAGTDEDGISSTTTTFTPFLIDAGYKGTDGNNFVDFHVVSNGDNSGVITAEFRNIKIIENNNSAVRIRRTAENREVIVGFDSNGKVSGDSPITNILEGTDAGDATVTNLHAFLNSRQQNFNPTPIEDIASTFNQWTSLTATKSSFSATTGNVDSNNSRYTYRLTAPHTASDSEITTYRVKGTISYSSAVGEKLFVKPTTSIDGGSSFTQSNVTVTGAATISSGLPCFNHGASGDFDIQFTGNGTDQLRSIAFLQTEMTGTSSVSITDLDISTFKHGATVHTWYDQAGANNAVQESLNNQPQLAANGVLHGGILFDNSPSGTAGIHLQSNEMTTGSATDNFVAAVVDRNSLSSSNMTSIVSTRSGNDGFTYGIHATGYPQVFFTGKGNYGVQASPVHASGKVLLSFDKDGTVATVHSNAATPTPSANTISGYTNSSNVFNIGTINRPNVNPTNGFCGLISELIVYNSDQSTNRFKIESNINNYYGLYNDDKSISQTSWVNTGTEGFSSTSTDGFSFSNSASTAFVGITLRENLPLNNSVYVSFNATGVTYPNSNNQSPQIRLRDSVTGGSGASTIINQITNGYNSFTLTYNDSAKSNGNHIVFSEGDTAGGTVTISNFRVSRINRSGFVEVLYDQSGNGRDMTQSNDSYQPKLVSNGSICKTNNGYNAILFDGSDDFLSTNTYEPADEPNGMTDFNLVCVTGRPPTQTQRVVASCGSQEGSHTIGGFYFSNNVTSGQSTKQDIRFNISEHDVTSPTNTSHIDQKIVTATPLQDTNLLSFNRKGSDNTFESFSMTSAGKITGTSLVPKTGQSAAVGAAFKIGASMYHSAGRKHYPGQILEVVFYDSNNRNNAVAINHNVKNQYQI